MSAVSGRMRMLMKNYLQARKSGAEIGYDIRPVMNENGEPNYEHYYILLRPTEGIYAGQEHLLEMKTKYGVGENINYYPQKAPYIRFKTHVWHVNVSSEGSICLDILKDASKWAPTYKFDQIMCSLKLLFEYPNPQSPFNSDAGKLWMECEAKFEHAKARHSHHTMLTVAEEELLRLEAFGPYMAQSAKVAAKNNLTNHYRYFAEHAEPAEELTKMFETFGITTAAPKQ
jgi:ubiquitin-protein ligase